MQMAACWSDLEDLIRWIIRAFRRHELWVLRFSERVPLLGLFALATLLPWGLPLIIGLIALIAWSQPILPGLTPLLAIGGLAAIVPWLFRWYILIFGLMVGDTARADTKRRKLLETSQRREI